jgi:hypothetical protein
MDSKKSVTGVSTYYRTGNRADDTNFTGTLWANNFVMCIKEIYKVS